MRKDDPPSGAYWMKTGYPPSYQLFRRLEKVADELERRRIEGYGPTRAHIVELRDISYIIKAAKINLAK